ncbi:Peptidyl-prolyl isomerase cwc27 [Onygenales sp. PD_40]|nr:Peptidyl-prolyl isomerase cwc27 [Onygenales sp. PD_40]KAK2799997.1 Peptidyl-prolyl isomerase cwc27 [Onygenales sp. PD_10]
MSSQYNTEPPPTASVTLQTTAGPLHISLFAKQTPLASKNFLQHCLDGYYNGTIFHRIVPDFVIQGGDPTGTGAGGSSIYEDPEFEFDSRDGEKVVFKDEIHSRLRFNRRGLVGMAKAEDGTYGSQFFVTLGSAVDKQLTGTCTMFGRVEGDSIYNVVRIAEGELVQGTERPVYAVKVTGCEVEELGPFKDLKKRDRIAVAAPASREEGKKDAVKKRKKAKGAKVLLSFADDDDEELEATKAPKKPKFNTKLVTGGDEALPEQKAKKPPKPSRETDEPPPKRRRSASPAKSPPIARKPPRDPNTQLPLPDPESPSRSPSPSPSASPPPPTKQSALSRTTAEIDALKASMRRNVSTPSEPTRKKSALESLIPETSIRGRRRPAPGASNGVGNSGPSSHDSEAMRMFNAFKARLEQADAVAPKGEGKGKAKSSDGGQHSTDQNEEKEKENNEREGEGGEEEEEEQLCDLHFIVNCQSCRAWDAPTTATTTNSLPNQPTTDADEDEADTWMTHKLTFGKDMLGKDLNWKRTHEDVDGLVVIDPREKEREVIGSKGRGRGRERERQRKMESGGGREWDRERDRERGGRGR